MTSRAAFSITRQFCIPESSFQHPPPQKKKDKRFFFVKMYFEIEKLIIVGCFLFIFRQTFKTTKF